MVAVGDKAQRQCQARQHQRPGIQIRDRAPAAEANASHAVVEVLAVAFINGLLVLQALEHNESRIQERHSQQDQRQHKAHDRGRLNRTLDHHAAHQKAQQVRAAVPHEARRRRKVVDQKAQRRACRQRRQHPRRGPSQIEGDHSQSRRNDRAHPRRQPIHAVAEVDDVHQRHQPHHGHGPARVGEAQPAHERQRYVMHHHPVVHDHKRRHDLPRELDRRVQIEAIIQRPHNRDQRGAQQHPLPHAARRAAVGQPSHTRHQHPREDRQAAQQRRRLVRQPPLARHIHGTYRSREAHRQRRQQRRHHRRRQESP